MFDKRYKLNVYAYYADPYLGKSVGAEAGWCGNPDSLALARARTRPATQP